MRTEELVKRQREFFASGRTFDPAYRIRALKRLEQAILKYENELYAALYADLGKSRAEAYMCEVGLTLSELRYVLRHLKGWSRNKRSLTPLAQFHAKSFTVQEPYGVVLVMSPWNYPVLLTLEPLIGALSAGNCCVVKPSAYSPETSRMLSQIIKDAFPEEYAAVVEGGRQENQSLLEQRFDYIFFTGGVQVGKSVMEKASAHLTPVTLELGGKSPCIIDKTADLKLAARRLVFGKYLNCGQTCVAPDYVLVQESVREQFTEYVKQEIVRQYGERPLLNPSYGKMINRKHFERVRGLIKEASDKGRPVYGGECDESALRIAPAVLELELCSNLDSDHHNGGKAAGDAAMQEEIFGPVLPIMGVKDMREAYAFVKSRPKPLALYIFTADKRTEEKFLREVPFGGGCVNDTIIHLATSNMGFGGVGNSGMGSYHGKKSFETFSHEKSIVKKYTWLDLPMRYQPYTTWKEKLVRMFVK